MCKRIAHLSGVFCCIFLGDCVDGKAYNRNTIMIDIQFFPKSFQKGYLLTGCNINYLLASIFCLFVAGFCPAGDLAGSIEDSVSVLVSGSPARWETIVNAIQVELPRHVTLQPGAEIVIDYEKMVKEKPLVFGHKYSVNVPFRIFGKGYILVNGVANIEVKNQAIAQDKIKRLFISNNPEAVDFPGMLFHEKIKELEDVRFLYYHKAIKRNLSISIIVTNKTNRPGNLWLCPSIGGPDADSVFAGHVAIVRAFNQKNDGEGIFISLQPGESVEIIKQPLKRGQTVSGIVEFQSLDAEFDLKMVAQGSGLGSESSFFQHDKDEDIIRGGVFDAPYLDFEVTFAKYQKERRLRLGDVPHFKDIYSGEILKGNYGVLYTYNIWLDNRANNQSRIIDLVMITGGGLARGVFQIYDRLSETKLLKSRAEEEILKRVELFPNELRKVIVQTMPQPGSFYPVNLLVRELDK